MDVHRNSLVGNSATTTQPLLLDVGETARLLNVSERYVRLLYARGDLPLVRLGRRTLVRRADVENIVALGGFQQVG